MEAVIESGTFQTSLLHAGRYQVAMVDERIIGCGGWLDGGAPAATGSTSPADRRGAAGRPAVIRAIYIDPAHARNGIGRRLMEAIEADSVAAGKTAAELVSTHMAIRFFASLGYAMQGPLALALPFDRVIEVFAMRKGLARQSAWRLAALGASTPHQRVVAA